MRGRRRRGYTNTRCRSLCAPTRTPASTSAPACAPAQRVKPGRRAGRLAPRPRMGELALGQNILVAFMSLEGGNFEDAILISRAAGARRRVHQLSILRSTKSRPARPSWGRRKSPATSRTSARIALKDLDERGIVFVGRGSDGQRYPRRQDHAEGRNRTDAGRAPVARYLRREGPRGEGYLAACAPRRARQGHRCEPFSAARTATNCPPA